MSEMVVPEGWEEKRLDELGEVVGGGTPASGNKDYWGGNVSWVTPSEVTNLQGRYVHKTTRTLTEEGLDRSSAKLHPSGTILLTTRASIGYPAINTVPMATNQGFQSLRPNDKFDSEYGYQVLLHNRHNLERLSSGSTFLEVSSKEVKKFSLPVPPLPEQQKIASILTSVDEVIEKTQSQINKLQDLKKGTMNELLTRGIGHTEFKDSPVGRIPKGWDVNKLGQVCSLIKDGTHLPPKRTEVGVPLLSVRNMVNGRFRLLDDDTYVSKDFYDKMHSKWKPQEGDLLLAVVGATIGKVAQVPNNFPVFTLQRSVGVIRSDNCLLINDFLFVYSQSIYFSKELWDRVNQTAQPGIYLSELGLINIPLPSLEEQNQIASILSSIDKNIEEKQRKLEQTKSLKKSLMQDLLTGMVRVPLQ